MLVRVRPRSRPSLTAEGDVLVVGVAAPALEGRATEEARRSLAAALRLPPSSVTLRSGGRSRTKVFAIAGPDAREVTRRLDSAVSGGT